jgi:hypothetical protein
MASRTPAGERHVHPRRAHGTSCIRLARTRASHPNGTALSACASPMFRPYELGKPLALRRCGGARHRRAAGLRNGCPSCYSGKTRVLSSKAIGKATCCDKATKHVSICLSVPVSAATAWLQCGPAGDTLRAVSTRATGRKGLGLPLRVGAALSDLRPRRHLLGRNDGDDPVDAHGANAHELPEPLAERGRGEIFRHSPPRTSRSRHRLERAPPAATDQVVRQLLQRRQNEHRGRQGLTVRASCRAEARPRSQRRQPPTGPRPASPPRLAPVGVSRFGPEGPLDRAAGSVGGRGSCARGPKASSIHAAGTTTAAPFPGPDALLHPASMPSCSRNVFLATHRVTNKRSRTPWPRIWTHLAS